MKHFTKSLDFNGPKIFLALTSLVLLFGCIAYILSSNEDTPLYEPETRISGNALNELRDEWIEIIDKLGAEEAHALFLKEASKNKEVGNHTYAHVFGEALYRVEGIDGVRACDGSFEFGCYHSFFGQAVYEEGIQVLPRFDQACRDAYGSKNLPCQHGIGHGLLIYTGYENVTDALLLCEEISWQPIGGCSSGVYMENNFHTMETVEGETYIRPFEGDIYAPCSNLEEKYQQGCYFDQVQWWLSLGKEYKEIAMLCDGLESEAAHAACYYGLGNFLAVDMEYDPARITDKCTQVALNEEASALCHQSASWIVNYTSGQDDAYRICEALAGDYKENCVDHLNMQQ